MKNRAGKLLVVEDEVLVGIMLARKLRSFGFTVGNVATTGEEAIIRAGEESPHVILMDVTLAGEINGIEAASVIKEKYNIPIIIFTGYDYKQVIEKTRHINPVAVISKMGPISDITDAIEQALKH